MQESLPLLMRIWIAICRESKEQFATPRSSNAKTSRRMASSAKKGDGVQALIYSHIFYSFVS